RITAAALLMAFTFLCMAGMFVLLGAETIALFQVLIYVGAITVLILYGVMFTKFGDRPRALFFQRQTPLAAVFVAAVAIPVAYIVVSAALFFIGCAGVLVRRNAVVILMCVELMLNAANLALVAFSRKYGSIDERGSVFVIFVFVIAAAEVAVGLGIILSAYRNRPVVNVDEIHQMKG